jgi:hypothetical protein
MMPLAPATGNGRARNGGTSDAAQAFGHVTQVFGRCGGRVGGLDLGVDLGPVHLDAPWRFNAETNGVTAHVEDHDANVIPDHDALPRPAGQNQHGWAPSLDPRRSWLPSGHDPGPLQAVSEP